METAKQKVKRKIVRFGYDLLKKFPSAKRIVKILVQFVVKRVSNKNNLILNNFTLYRNSWFGFHDKSPFSPDCEMILFLGADFDHRMPQVDETVSIYIRALNSNNSREKISESLAWNWHQGCMLQWINNDRIGYNTYKNDKPAFFIIDKKGSITDEIPYHINSVCQNKIGIGYDFEWVNQLMPGYGYVKRTPESDVSLKPSNGLYGYDLAQQKISWHHTIEEIIQIVGISPDSAARYFVTHVQPNESQSKVLFLLRSVRNNLQKRTSYLCIANIDGTQIEKFDIGNMCSHMGWIGDDRIAAYCSNKDDYDGLFILNTETLSTEKLIPRQDVSFDTHPSYSKVNHMLICDSYADLYGQNHLFTIDLRNGDKRIIAKLKCDKNFVTTDFNTHIQCDLHPRWSADGKRVSIDTSFTGERCMAVFDVD